MLYDPTELTGEEATEFRQELTGHDIK
jgi:hypothetical protein